MYNGNIFARSILEIDLSRIIINYQKVLSLVGTTNVAAVVKANAYSLGAPEVSTGLYKAGCRDFYFAYLDEVIDAFEAFDRLRGARIYLLNGLRANEIHYAAEHGIIPVLNTLASIEQWGNYAKKIGRTLPAIIHLETGMGRLGLQRHEINKAVGIEAIQYIDIYYIMSHLACASEVDHMLNQQQLQAMHEFAASFPKTKISFANSAGVLLGREYHMDQVRPGCALYGVNPIPDTQTAFVQVATLKAYVLQLKELERDQNISYGGRYYAKKGTKIATLACGYADGYHRILTNNAYGFYAGFRVPIIGTVTMDMVMADVSEIPEQLLEKMEYVELLGDNITVDELASRAKTIGYEILTSLGYRFKRLYTG